MNSDGGSRTRALASHVAEHPAQDIPPEVIFRAKRSLLDALGVSLAASTLGEASGPFVSMARGSRTSGGVPVIGHDFLAPPSLAALANGALAHELDFEDTHDQAIVHPHAAAIPAALSALADAPRTDGLTLLAGIIHGANLVCRVSLGLVRNPEEGGWFLHPMLNVYAAAAAASRVLGSSAAQTESALSLAFTQSTGSVAIKNSPRSDLRAVRDGFNAQAGVIAASVAREGTVGFAGVFDHPGGFYDLYGGGEVDEDALLLDLDSRWEGSAVSFKPWPSCRGTHSFVECALDILRRPGFDVSRISEVRLRVSPFYMSLCEPRGQKARPQSASQAKFSIPFVLATALLRGRVALEDFAPDAITRHDVIALAERVTARVDESLGLRESMSGGVVVTLRDGRTFDASVSEPRGSLGNPMGEQELMEKFESCARLAKHPPADIRGLAELVLGLEREPDARKLLAALAPRV